MRFKDLNEDIDFTIRGEMLVIILRSKTGWKIYDST